MAKVAKAIAGALVAGGGAAVASITAQCGHSVDWLIVAGAVLAGFAAVYRVSNAPSSPPAQPGVGG